MKKDQYGKTLESVVVEFPNPREDFRGEDALPGSGDKPGPRVVDPVFDTDERRTTSLTDQLWATPAPAVGVLTTDIVKQSIPALVQGYSATGPIYAANPARFDPRAAVLQIASESNGRYLSEAIYPGAKQNWILPKVLEPSFGLDAPTRILNWLEAEVMGVRELPGLGELPLLVLCGPGTFAAPAAALERIAIKANAVIAVVQHVDGATQDRWQAKQLKPAPPAEVEAEPEPVKRSDPKPVEGAIPAAVLTKAVLELRGWPERFTLRGHTIDVAWVGTHAAFRGWREEGGRQVPLEVEVAPGQTQDISDFLVRLA